MADARVDYTMTSERPGDGCISCLDLSCSYELLGYRRRYFTLHR
jgi:hypothetical protein